MKFLKWLLLVVLTLVVVILVVSLFLPKKFRIESSEKIKIGNANAFQMIATYSNRASWDPWMETDSAAKVTIETAEGYAGSKYSWEGPKVGKGQEIIDSVDFGRYIQSHIRFNDMEQLSLNEWEFLPENDSTLVVWRFTSDASYPVGRIFMALMENQLKSSFDKGLSNLKLYLEDKGYSLSSLTGIELSEFPPSQSMAVRVKLKMNEIEGAMESMFSLLMNEISAGNLEIAGPPFTNYFNWNQETNETEMYVGIPVKKTGKGSNQVVPLKYPAMKVLKAIHTGPYNEIHSSYNTLMQYAKDNNIKVKMESWEIYVTEPSAEPDMLKWKTMIAFPLEAN